MIPAAPGFLTVGHGTLEADAFADLVLGAGITEVVDVRSFPGSRRHPHFGREEMQRWLPLRGVSYQWERPLGGFRKALPDSVNTSLRNTSFRGYADYMMSEEFAGGVDRLLSQIHGRPDNALAIMCSEGLWWRCHRRLIADFLTLARGCSVRHVMPDGKLVVHPVTAGARLAEDGRLRYDG